MPTLKLQPTDQPGPNGQARFIELPTAPITASPVPELTSIHSVKQRGPYGDSRYRGNCGGYIIRDLLQYFRAESVFDPMSGSGTCRDVCRELDIPCDTMDIRKGQDAADPACYENRDPVDFIWMHPPYWKMIRYNDDPPLSFQRAIASSVFRSYAVNSAKLSFDFETQRKDRGAVGWLY